MADLNQALNYFPMNIGEKVWVVKGGVKFEPKDLKAEFDPRQSWYYNYSGVSQSFYKLVIFNFEAWKYLRFPEGICNNRRLSIHSRNL